MIHSQELIKKRVLIVGASGMLGQSLIEKFSGIENIELLGASFEENYFENTISYKQIDISKRESIKKVVYDFYPDLIINAAAFTNVDLCEKERELSWKINVKGVEYLSDFARIIDAHIIHVSTDYVFDGKNGPYTESDTPKPISYYGRTKLASENALKLSGAIYTIVRTNVLYGAVKYGRPDFVRWLVNTLRDKKEVRIVTDQINNPTYLEDLAQGIYKISESKKCGIFNIGGLEFLSRLEFSYKIAEHFNLDKNLITPIQTYELNQPAPRPLNSGLVILKAQTMLNYKPQTIKETLIKMEQEI